jgi:hypothetical protein
MSKFNLGGSQLPAEGGNSQLTEFIPGVDEVSAKIGPNNVRWHLEDEYEAAEEEQRQLWRSQGEDEAREHDVRAAATKHDADIACKVSVDLDDKAARTEARYDEAHGDLWQFRRRPVDHKWVKWLRWGLLIGGDAAGVTGAALLMGEPWITAGLQATSIGAAVVCLGAVGRDLRFLTAHRARRLQISKS